MTEPLTPEEEAELRQGGALLTMDGAEDLIARLFATLDAARQPSGQRTFGDLSDQEVRDAVLTERLDWEAEQAARQPSGDLAAAATETVAAWDRYIEAHAGRGHEGPHEPDKALDGNCGPCAGAEYGTEVEMAEYVIPALRAALLTAPAPALHPDDGHEHSWGCRRCGVDPAPAPGGLDVEAIPSRRVMRLALRRLYDGADIRNGLVVHNPDEAAEAIRLALLAVSAQPDTAGDGR